MSINRSGDNAVKIRIILSSAKFIPKNVIKLKTQRTFNKIAANGLMSNKVGVSIKNTMPRKTLRTSRTP